MTTESGGRRAGAGRAVLVNQQRKAYPSISSTIKHEITFISLIIHIVKNKI
jgi:hypothetical protein